MQRSGFTLLDLTPVFPLRVKRNAHHAEPHRFLGGDVDEKHAQANIACVHASDTAIGSLADSWTHMQDSRSDQAERITSLFPLQPR
jgi:hypothetical protein